MISQNSIGYDEQIQTLLEKACLTMTQKQIQAWMKYIYEPEHMFCTWEDNQITSCLQVHERTMKFMDKQCRVSVIGLACTLPDYRQRKQFSNLLDAACQQATYNDLITITYTSMPRLFESKTFQTISNVREFWIGASLCKKGNLLHIDKNIKDLYPVYFEFMQFFDGSLIENETEFNNKINYYKNYANIISIYNDQKELRGFAIYTTKDHQAHIETIVYLDSQVIHDALTYLSLHHEVTSIKVSESERIDKLFPLHLPRAHGVIMARLNNYKLFDKWTNTDIRNIKSAFDLLEKPMWNHFQ